VPFFCRHALLPKRVKTARVLPLLCASPGSKIPSTATCLLVLTGPRPRPGKQTQRQRKNLRTGIRNGCEATAGLAKGMNQADGNRRGSSRECVTRKGGTACRVASADNGDSKNGIVEIAARQSFSTVGLGISLASELVKMIPKATGFALQSPCQLGWTIWGSSSSRPQNQGLGGAPHFIPFIPVKKTSMHLHPCFPVLAIPAVAMHPLRLRKNSINS
jgi:hypothetical protein